MADLPENLRQPMIHLLFSIADDKLFLGHRNSNWTGLAPILEADIAFSSLAQDDIAHASALYELASILKNQTADHLAFGRDASEYLCADIVTRNDEFNWAAAIARQFFCNHFDYCRLTRLKDATWKPLADLSNRLLSEQAIHIDHVNTWILHLGNGTEESKSKIQHALDTYSKDAAMLFEKPEGLDQLQSDGVLPHTDDFFELWKNELKRVTDEANLTLSIETIDSEVLGGRSGIHCEDFMECIKDLQGVYLQDPAATW